MSSVITLLSVPLEKRDKRHLVEMLQCALKLEHSTLPPYLTAMWSIKDRSHPAYKIIRSIIFEEMAHLGIVCNLLSTIGERPILTSKDFVPRYPSGLPCGITPRVIPPNVVAWNVGLSRLTPSVVSDVFMIIEYPEKGPVQVIGFEKIRRHDFHTIGEFYDAIALTLKYLVENNRVCITGERQLSDPFDGHNESGQNVLNPITTLEEALRAIEHIKQQGEGTPTSPDAPHFGHELAHYYKFKQIQTGRFYQRNADKWSLSGAFMDFPQVYSVEDITTGGYECEGTPQDVRDQIKKFNEDYGELLRLLEAAWQKGGAGGKDDLEMAKQIMRGLGPAAVKLMKTSIGAGRGHYGPTFDIG